MDNFKDIAEKVLAGELKGVFKVLKVNNGTIYNIPSSSIYATESSITPYEFINKGIEPSINADILAWFNNKGVSELGYYIVVDFIEDKIMNNKCNVEITLEKAKEWYKTGGDLKEVALQAFKEEELKDNKPRSWKEYCDNFKGTFYYIQDNYRDNIGASSTQMGMNNGYKNYVPSKELAEAFLALMQLISLRQAWIGDWLPDWTAGTWKFVVQSYENTLCIDSRECTSSPLSFPTQEMAREFLSCFRDLLETAKILI